MGENDVKQRDQCGLDIKANEAATRDAERLKQVTESNIDGLESEIAELGQNIEAAKEEIVNTKTAIKQASQDREGENADFQVTVKEQRDMGAVLLKAYDVLKTHYSKTSFIQAKQTPMPGEFEAYKGNAGSSQ